MKNWPYALLICGYLWANVARAQTPRRPEIDLNQFIQNLFPVQNEDINYGDLYESLFQLYANPIDLNTATRDDLAGIYLLSETQLDSFFEYRKTNGNFISVYELQAVPDFSLEVIYRLLPFVVLDTDRKSLTEGLDNPSQNYLILRYEQTLEQQKGFTAPDVVRGKSTSRFVGSPAQLYARYRYSRSRDFSFGFTLEKDPGEQTIWRPATHQYGPDFISFHGQVQNRGALKNLIVGDYQLQIGQGLVYAAGFSLGKGAEPVATARRPTLGARPFTSLLEGGFFRGATATYSLGRYVEITGLYSRTRRDASTGDDPNTETPEDFISSILSAGLHRTPTEIANRAKIVEQNAGAHLQFKKQNLQVGITALYTHFDGILRKRPLPYNRFEFTGSQNLVLGLHANWLWQNFNFFGEAARSRSGGLGAVGGFVASLSKNIDMAVVVRHYDPNFQSFYANAFGENTRTINESGVYWGIKYSPTRRWTFGAFYDSFTFPWLKYLVDAPSRGHDYMLSATCNPSRTISIYGFYHREHKSKNQPDNTTNINFLVNTVRQTTVLNLQYALSRQFSLHSRVQWGSFTVGNQKPSEGFVILQDANFDWGRLSVSGRFALFDTDGFDGRQYVYEKDVLYAFSIPAFANRGARNYVMAQYSFSKHLDLWLRWARTSYRNLQTVGSGLNAIDGPTRSELKAQIRWRF